MQPETVDCQVCQGLAERVTWNTRTARADYRCQQCRAGGAITASGRHTGPVLEGTTQIATKLLRRRAHA